MRATVALLLLLAPGPPVAADPAPSRPQLIVTQLPVTTGARDEDALPDGSRLVLIDPARPEVAPRLLSQGFAAAGRACVSDDGTKFLFVGRRKRGETLDAWEGDLRGGAPRRVTHRAEDCLDAFYLSTLYTIDATAPEPRLGLRCAVGDGAPALFTCRPDGSDERRVTFTPCRVSGPLALSDGRIVFASGCAPADPLFVVNIDGTDVQAFARAGEGAAGAPCETPDGRVVFVEAGHALISVRRERSLLSREVLLRDEAAEWRAPAALDDASLVVSRRAAGASWDLARVGLAPDPRVETLLATQDWDETAAAPVVARGPRPGRSSVVEAKRTGFLYCLDAFRTGLQPPRQGGAAAAGRLDVVTAGDAGASKVLATVPVETDGSFYLKVPARTPLRVRLLDGSGTLVSEMTSWIWVMPSEARGCIGCHEDPSLTPPNRQVLALRNAPREAGP